MSFIDKILDLDSLKAEFEFIKIHQKCLELETELKEAVEERDRLIQHLNQTRLFQLSQLIILRQEQEKQEKEQKELEKKE